MGSVIDGDAASHRPGNGYDLVTSGGTAQDCYGHGTHPAGTLGGTNYGVARVTLHPVRVLDCEGRAAILRVIAGVDWVKANTVKPAVVNISVTLTGMSFCLGWDPVANLVAAGITTVVAAGNANAQACGYWPAKERTAITVGATTNTDNRAAYSNYGSCLDVFAAPTSRPPTTRRPRRRPPSAALP